MYILIHSGISKYVLLSIYTYIITPFILLNIYMTHIITLYA